MSLDITIKVDPGNATAAAAKVEAALGKVEDQAAKVGPAVAKSMREGSTAVDKLKASSDAAGGSLSGIAKDVAGINFKQGAAGAAQAFELLNQHLKITDSTLGNVVGSVIKFGAAGAQVAGPIGALAGAGVGALATLGEAIFDANAAVEKQNEINRKSAESWAAQTEATAKARQEALDAAPGIAALAERQRELAEATATAAQVTGQWADAFRKANTQANAYADELIRINKATGDFKFPKRFGVLGQLFAGASETEDEAKRTRNNRGLEIKDRERYAAGKSYGDLLVELETAELKRRNRLEDLTKVMTDQNVSAEVQKKALKEYNSLVKPASDGTSRLAESNAKAAAAAKAHADELQRLTVLMLGTGKAEPTLLGKTGADADRMSYTEREFKRSQELAAYDSSVQDKVDALSAPVEPDLAADLAAHAGGKNPALEAANDRMTAANERLTTDIQRQQAALDALQGAATMAGDALVDAFMGADVSAKELIKTITTMLAKQALGALIGAGFGALSPTTPKLGGARTGMDAMVPAGRAPFLPGFATGGDMLVGGSGGPDTKIAAFRVSPGESIHVRTPQQRDTAQRSTGGGSKTVNINVPGARDAVTEHNLEGLVVRVVERNNPALRSRLRG